MRVVRHESAAAPFDEVVAAHSKMTTPDAEDWHILVDGPEAYVIIAREFEFPGADGGTERRAVAVAGKFDVPQLVLALQGRSNLGCVTVILPSDAEKYGGRRLLRRLEELARESGGFNVMSLLGSARTAEAVRTWNEMHGSGFPIT